MRFRVIVLAVALAGCGAPEKKVTRSDEGVDPAKAGQLLEEADKETDAGNWSRARDLLREAYRYSDVATRQRIDAAGERLDDKQAAAVAGEAKKLAEEGECAEAMQTVATTVSETGDAQVPGILRKASQPGLVACVSKLIEDSDLVKARAVVTLPATATALDKATFERLKSELSDAIVSVVLARMTPAMESRDWPEATKVLQTAVDAGEVGTSEREALLEAVRLGVSEDVEKIASAAFGQEKGAREALTKVDELLRAGMWKPRSRAVVVGPKTAAERMLAQGKDTEAVDDGRPPVPEKLHRLREELAFSIACGEVKCKEVAPGPRWLYGNAWIHPLASPKAETENSLDHGQQVWIVAEGGGLALVAQKDPGQLADLAARAHVGAGWVASAALKNEDTKEWLPPGDSILGTRVWGPLREGEKELEIGIAMKVEGNSVGVERLSDKAIVTVPRAQLQYGLVKSGLEVLALCQGMNLTPARIEEVFEPKHRSLGDPKVKLVCKGAGGDEITYEEQLGAVRIKRESLPPRK